MRRRKWLSMILALCLIVGMLPTAVFAAGSSKRFEDVDQSKWYVPYVEFVIDHGLMVGTSKSKFSPKGDVTRAQFVQTLYAIANKPAPKSTSKFVDLRPGAYYVDAVTWASSVGVTSGITKTTFGPNQKVTREQAVTFFKAFAENVAGIKTEETASISSYSDAQKVSKFAKDAMSWAVGAKLIAGVKQGKTILLDSKGVLNRAQLATVLKAFASYLEPMETNKDTDPTVEPSTSPDTQPTTVPSHKGSSDSDDTADTTSNEETALGEITADINKDGKFPVDEVKVVYTLNDGTGYVDIDNIEYTSYLSLTPGAVSCPVDITAVTDTVKSADIIFHVNDNALQNADINDLGIVWFDEENNKSVLLDNSVIDYENDTISVHTTHFSKYIVVNTKDWYEVWAKEQLVPRNTSSGNTENGSLYNVIFALDNSGSMEYDMDLLKKATASFVGLLDENDKYSIVTFSTDAEIIVKSKLRGDGNYSDIFNKTYNDLSGVYSDGLTNYEKGLSTALSLVIESQEEEDKVSGKGRQALLVYLSDGEPTTNYTQDTLELLQHLANNANCRCVTIGLGDGVNEYYLKEMATVGNGTYRHVSNSSELNDLFELINGWYIGSTQDSDGDGIPDIVEKTGMRTNYGFIITTDPNLSDTDGDGISDGEEIGKFVQDENNKSSYFEINSDPTITTKVIDTAKLKVVSAGMVPDISAYNNQTTISQDSFEKISKELNKYSIAYNMKAIGIERSGDYLTEVAYGRDPVYRTSVSVNESCGAKTQIGTTTTLQRNTNADGKMAMNCSKGLLNCKNEHRYNIDIDCSNGSVDWSDTQYLKFSTDELWKSIVQKYLQTITSDYQEQSSKYDDKCKSVINSVNTTYTNAVDADRSAIKKKLEINYLLEAEYPSIDGKYNNGDTVKDITDAFLGYYLDYLQQQIIDHPSKYKNTKTTTQLVNAISKSIYGSNTTFVFKTSRSEYTAELSMIGITMFGGGSFSSAIIKGGSFSGRFMEATTAKEQDISSEMSELYDFANAKMDDAIKKAKSEVISASASMMPSDVKSSLEKLLNKKIVSLLNAKNAGLGDKIEKALGLTKKFIDLKKSYDSLKGINLNNKEPSSIISAVTSYSSKLAAWKTAVNAF